MSSTALGTIAEDEASTGRPAWESPEEVQKQLERVVSSTHFRNSKRYPALLRYLVQQSLLGRMDALKERTLGIEVFGRPADYDTNADPVVRITAGEVRKRIAQYYQSPNHDHELRLDLPLGSYALRFLPPHETTPLPFVNPDFEGTPEAHLLDSPLPVTAPLIPENIVSAPELEASPADAKRRPLRSKRMQAIFALGTLVVLALSSVTLVDVANARRQEAGMTFFWGPILRSKAPAMIVLGVHSFDTHGNDLSPTSLAQLPQGGETVLNSMIRSNMVSISDVVSYSEVVSVLAQHSLPLHTQSAAETTIEEFRRGPIVLIGGFDNMWTMRLTSTLRFRFGALSNSLHEIQDTQHPDSRWQFDNSQSALSTSRDYAIVARFFDPQIEQLVIVIAGIGKSGTEAAAEFVTDKDALRTWTEALSVQNRENIEVVLSTDVIEGKHGPPHVVASDCW
ncbi:hypothetical protein [Granulicella aggregans]|jgi:hypothetical protein|uniref:hypothetical protein n=1 Tax=Granulicella aggregans TaxID=474949 RepID=UPI0021E02FFB|nr:hypothetical protein [Granulicella aggregans]